MENSAYKKMLIERYDNYSSIEDYNGEKGHAIMDAVMETFGSLEAMENYKIELKINGLKKLCSFSSITPKRGSNMGDVPLKIFRKKLSMLRAKGDDVPKYSEMNKQEMYAEIEKQREIIGREISDLESRVHID